MIFIIKVTTNKEERAVDMIAERAMKKDIAMFSVSRPHGLRGYIILEAKDREKYQWPPKPKLTDYQKDLVG